MLAGILKMWVIFDLSRVQENVGYILMLCDYVEQNKKKCEKYVFLNSVALEIRNSGTFPISSSARPSPSDVRDLSRSESYRNPLADFKLTVVEITGSDEQFNMCSILVEVSPRSENFRLIFDLSQNSSKADLPPRIIRHWKWKDWWDTVTFWFWESWIPGQTTECPLRLPPC